MSADGEPMKDRSSAPVVLAHRQPFRIGAVEVRPATRELIGPESRETIEPRIMQVLVALHDAGGEIVSRDDLTMCCWDGRVVGDDAINRVISRIRRLGETVGAGAFGIETITKVGYRLVTAEGGEPAAPRSENQTLSRRAVLGGGGALALAAAGGAWWISRSGGGNVPAEAREQFELGLELFGKDRDPAEATAAFQRAADLAPDYADAWGYLALSLEVGRFFEPPQSADLSERRSLEAAERALQLDPRNAPAIAAQGLASPLYGDWLTGETRLRQALEIAPRLLVARDYLSRVLEHVGRTRDALAIVEPYPELFAALPGVQYRLTAMLWASGRLQDAERTIDGALRRWPAAYPVWFTRYWLYARSGRPQLALEMSARLPRPRDVPAWNFELNDLNTRALLTRSPADVERALAANREAAARGAGFCENAVHLAAQLGLADEAFALTEAYFFGRGFRVADTRFSTPNQTYSPSYRRQTGYLFMPSTAPMRGDPRFGKLCEETGLARYWRRSGTRADVLA